MFVTFEGLDGSGKSTQAALLRARLEADGVDVVSTREPGGTELGEKVRDLVLHGGHVAPWAEALLYAAARAQHVDEVIRPALERGAAVICDRYVDSSVAYQGVGRGLGLERVLELNLAAVGGLLPDRTFLLCSIPRRSTPPPAASTTGSSASRRRSTRGRRPAIASWRGASPSASSSSTPPARPTSSRRRCMDPFASVPEQAEAKRLLTAALTEGSAHAYLLHGPAGVGKRTAAFAFAGALLGDERRVVTRSHPDLYLLEPLGEMIRIDDVRALRHDLHMRPFEGDRRVYLVLDADRMNDEAADALLKDLEEPPSYAVIVLVAGELGPLPPTILSRCQLVPFRRLSERAVREWVGAQAPDRSEEDVRVLARAAAGRLDRARRLLDPHAAARRDALVAAARSVYLDAAFDPGAAVGVLLGAAGERGEEAREREQALVDTLDLPARDAEQRVRRAQRGAERDELLAGLEGLEAWYRDLVVVAAGAENAAVHADRLDDLREDVAAGASDGAVEASEVVRDAWRTLEEFNLNPALALEAMFVRVARTLRPAVRV